MAQIHRITVDVLIDASDQNTRTSYRQQPAETITEMMKRISDETVAHCQAIVS